MTLSTNQDFLDVIDLDSALKTGSGYHERAKQNANGPVTERYNISLESITDDELRYVTRSLITPVSFQNYGTDDRLWSCSRTPFVTRQRTRLLPRNEQDPTFRSESAAIFNRLAEDELSVDFATRDLSEFMDPVLLEQVISRPGSRAPRNYSSNVDDGVAVTFVQSPASNFLRPHSTEGPSKDKERQRDTLGSSTFSTDFERNQHARLTPKRHSLHGDILMALRRDSDALLQRRESLLKLRKFSEGHQTRLEPHYKSDIQYRSDRQNQTEQQHRPEAQYKDTRAQPYDTDPVGTFKLKKENQLIKITPEVLPKKNEAPLSEHHRARRVNGEPQLERRKSHLNVPSYQRETQSHSQIAETFCDRNKRRDPSASVTESAKSLLARVRQHRVEEDRREDEINDRRRRSDSRVRWTDTQKSPDQQTRRYLSLDEYTPGQRPSSFSAERNNELKGSGGNRRRWSSSLPVSNIQYSPIQQDKLDHTTRRKNMRPSGHYVAKKSTLDRSTDRYVTLLGKPPSSK